MREGSVSATLSGYEASASEGGRRTRAWQRLGAPLRARLNGWIERGLPLQQLLFLALLSVSAIPALVFAVWEDRTAMTREMDAARDKHLVIAKHLAQALTRYERDVTAVFRFVVSQGERAGKAPGMPDLLTSLDFRYLCIFDDRNATLHLWMAPQMSRASLPQPELKRLLREKALAAPGKPVMTNFMLSGGTPLLFLVQTVDDHSFAVAGIGAGYFSELRKAITFGEHGHAAIFDRAGHIIAHPSPEWEATLHDLSQAPPVAAAMRGGTGVTTFFSPAVKAQMITGYAAVPGVGWGVMVPQPLSEIAARAHSARDVAFAIGGAGLVLAALVAGAPPHCADPRGRRDRWQDRRRRRRRARTALPCPHAARTARPRGILQPHGRRPRSLGAQSCCGRSRAEAGAEARGAGPAHRRDRT